MWECGYNNIHGLVVMSRTVLLFLHIVRPFFVHALKMPFSIVVAAEDVVRIGGEERLVQRWAPGKIVKRKASCLYSIIAAVLIERMMNLLCRLL